MKRISFEMPTVTAAALAALVFVGCVQPPPLVVQSPSGNIVPLEAWTGNLVASGASDASGIRGSVMLVPGSTIRETRAVVTIAGATPNAVHPWYVQLGDCGNDRGVLAGLMAYPPIAVDESGEARTSVTLPFTLPTSGRYFVSVRRSETDVSTVIACGNLTKASDAAPQTAGYVKAAP